ncbi:MAG: PAS domain S-box protein [Acidobacteria bacterium]|nr:PAS domain S-box protein [Acidobacteriota bacterium]
MSIRGYLLGNKRRVLVANAFLVAAIALVSSQLKANTALTFLYVFPMLVGGSYMSRAGILALAAVCTVLRNAFTPSPFETDAAVRSVMSLFAYFGIGLFVSELTRAQQRAVEESRLRQEAEEQLRTLIESSPAAILTVDTEGKVLQANEAAHRLLGYEPERLPGEPIGPMLPVLTTVPRAPGTERLFRSTVECTGRRRSGEVFLAQVWFSTYQTATGPRLAAIIYDGSEDLRDREGVGLHSVMNTSQILVRAALHEVRNLAAAAAVAQANLARLPGVGESEDFKALGALVQGLEKIASSELRPASDRVAGKVDLQTTLDELRIVIEPPFREAGVSVHWEMGSGMPPARGDHHGLLQVFLNLAQNSLRAMQDAARKEFRVVTSFEQELIHVRFFDTGRGVPVPDRLFQPMQPGAEATGLGLYISRAIVRSFAGDLRYEPQPLGSCFTVQLAPARAAVAAAAS